MRFSKYAFLVVKYSIKVKTIIYRCLANVGVFQVQNHFFDIYSNILTGFNQNLIRTYTKNKMILHLTKESYFKLVVQRRKYLWPHESDRD